MSKSRIFSTILGVCSAFTIGTLVAQGSANTIAAPIEAVSYQRADKWVNDEPAIEQWFPTVREAADGLPGHTVYRPADMSRFKPNSVPVIVWANGACRDSNYGFVAPLTSLANHGFVVIANGAYDAPVGSGGTATPSKLIDAINWAEGGKSNSQFKNRLDTTRVGVAGQSCGGLEALVAGADPRADSVANFNSGFFPTPTNGYGREQLTNLHTPTLFANGGISDVAYQNSIDNYNLTTTPTYLASNAHAGHSGLFYGIRDGNGDTNMADQGAAIITNWFDFTLRGNATAKGYFFGDSCGLCSQPDWTVQSKNWS